MQLLNHAVNLAVLSITFAAIAVSQPPNPCIEALPKDGLGAVYNVLRTYNTDDIKLLVDEYAYEKNWSSHKEAIDAGLSYGASAYGETLSLGSNFNKETKSQWMRQFEQRRHVDFMQKTNASNVVKTLDPSIVRVLGASCFSTGAWSVQNSIDACHFTFQAGYRSDLRSGSRITPLLLTVTGGACTDWPKNLPLSPQGDSITCSRSDKGGPMTVALLTKEAGTVAGNMPAFIAQIPPEPFVNHVESGPKEKNIELYRTRDFVHDGGNVDCGASGCKELYHADFSPGEADGRIISVQVVSCGDGECRQWYPCGGQQGCGGLVKSEFTRVGSFYSDCADATSCRIWRITTDGNNNKTTVKVTYKIASDTCVNCLPGLDYTQSHERWLKEKERLTAYNPCAHVNDPTPQELRTGVYKLIDKLW